MESKIAFVTHSLARGGSPISLLNLARRLTEFPRLLISQTDGPMREAFEQAQTPVFIQPRTGFLEFKLVVRLLRLFRQEQVRLVHLNTLTSYYKYAALAARIRRIPVVWFVREDARQRRCRKLFFWLKNFSDRIVPVSQEIAKNLYPGKILDKVQVIYNGIEIVGPGPGAWSRMRQDLGIDPGSPLIGCVASLEERKGISDLIGAIGCLRKKGRAVHLVCLGQDRSSNQAYRLKLVEQIERAGLKSNVHLLGEYPQPLSVYREFDLFVLPTYWEGCARTLLEAMLQKCPIITTAAGGNPEVIRHQVSGLLVPPGDIRALADAMERLLKDPELASRYAQAAHQDLRERFGLERHVAAARTVYTELLQRQV